MPYLINGKLVCIQYNLVLYAANVIKLFCYDKYKMIAASDPFSIDDLNNLHKIKALHLIKITDKNILIHLDNIINELIIPFFKKLLQYDIKPYPESNAGFYEFIIDIKFIQIKNNKYIPVIHQITHLNAKENNEYYKWLCNSVILPHFGLNNTIPIPPVCGVIKHITKSQSFLQYSIIKNIHLEFNKERTMVQIYYNYKHSGLLKLHIIENNTIHLSYIEITIKEDHFIKINVIFILMNILSAYYAPLQMFLLLTYEKEMDNIAFELEFSKKEDYYIRKCKI
jgi:hypothetical protein